MTVPDYPINRVGHQGLFFERYNGSFNEPTIAANIAGLYYNRNRFYSPTLGRFITRDPNETATTLITAMTKNGGVYSILLRSMSSQSFDRKSATNYLYLDGNPLTHLDPSGLMGIANVGTSMSFGEWMRWNSAQASLIGLSFAKSFGLQLAVYSFETALLVMSFDPSVTSSAMQDLYLQFCNWSRDNLGKADALKQHLNNTMGASGDPNNFFREVYNSVQDWPGWKEGFQYFEECVEVHDEEVSKMLERAKSGKWIKVMWRGTNSPWEIHFFRHVETGVVTGMKWKD